MQKKKYRQIITETLSEYTNTDTANLIYDICNDDTILIPNTFNRNEFSKYWVICKKRTKRSLQSRHDLYEVGLYSHYLSLIGRGVITSIKGYKPSKTAKLKLECKFKFHHPRDFMTFSLQTNGLKKSHERNLWGDFDTNTQKVHIFREVGGNLSNNRIRVRGKDDDGFTSEREVKIDTPPLDKELFFIMIDDGCVVNVAYRNGDGGKEYFVEFPSNSTQAQYFRTSIMNRETKGGIADITHLQLSVVHDFE